MILCLAVILVYVRIVTMCVFTDKYKEDIFTNVNLNKKIKVEREGSDENVLSTSAIQRSNEKKKINQKVLKVQTSQIIP